MLEITPFSEHLSAYHINSDKCNRTVLSCPTAAFPKSTISSSYNDNIICPVDNHLRPACIDTIRLHNTKYSDVPKSSRILDKNRLNILLNEKRKSIELIFKENPKPITNNSKHHHIGLQTDYRDDSTQTDPFSPAYTISGGEHPEVFALSDFTYGKGLPATSLEISFIERLRARREWEQDHTIDMTRTKIVIEREIRQWQIREKEIKMLQDTRHKLFTKNLHTYIETDEDLTQNIMDLSLYRHEKQLKFQHERLEIDTLREIRRIKRMYRLQEAQINAVTSYHHLGVIGMGQRGNGCCSSLKPPWHTRPDDIITTFKNNILRTSIPCSQFDYLIDRRMKQAGMNIFKFEELLPKIDESNTSMILQNNRTKKSSRRIRDLEKAYQLIQEDKTKQLLVTEKKPLRFVEKIETIDPIKQSQIIPTQTETHDRRRIAIIKLQNYLRGVIVQSKISNVRQIREDLLIELRSGLKHDQNLPFDITKPARTQIYDYLADATIADMFDFLSKELLRLQSEQTIHLFILLADRYRYQREAAETGCRTRSIERQKLEECAFQEMFSFDSNCDIEIYLQDLILESISNTSDEQARLEIQQITETLINLTDQINHSSSNQSNIETIVAELVHNFLFPTVQRLLNKNCKQHR